MVDYSPRRRTALVLTGTGTAGAYHAGVLWAFHEAGVKIDLVAGQGIGAVGAAFTAIDGGSRLWEAGGLWRSAGRVALYRWQPALRIAGMALAAAILTLVAPLAVLVVALLVYPVEFILDLTGIADSAALVRGYGRLVELAFQPGALPTILPRLAMGALLVFLAALLFDVIRPQKARRRRAHGALWWKTLGVPVDGSGAVGRFTGALWEMVRGAARHTRPPLSQIGHRYSELLGENLGQPHFHELLLVAHDIDARRDLVFGLLAPPYAQGFFLQDPADAGSGRGAEVFDLSGVAQEHAIDALVASLSVPVATEAHLVQFPPTGYWRGETHRLCDRPEALGRLLEEVARAGVDQLILISALPPPGEPHGLGAHPRDPLRRAGEYLASAETAALQDGLAAARRLFGPVFEIRPLHNSLGPFDFAGAYDERSDRTQTLSELVDRGYEDAYRQFVDPVVGASGETIHEVPERSGA